MAKHIVDCPECGTKSTVRAATQSPIQCCPFCGNTILPADNDEDEGSAFDDDSESDD